jgi:hypothetical protein
MRTLFVSLVALLIAAPVSAQIDKKKAEAIVAQERQKVARARLGPADTPPVLMAVASRLAAEFGGKWGLLVKNSGNRCAGNVACDIVCNETDHFDVLNDAPDSTMDGPKGCTPDAACADGKADGIYHGTSRPDWQPVGAYAPRVCRFVAAAPTPDPTPDPDPDPPPLPSCDLGPVIAQIDEVSGEVKAYGDLTLDVLAKTCSAATLEQLAIAQAAHAASLEEHRAEVQKAYSMAKDWKFWASTFGAAVLGYLAKVKGTQR